MNILAVDIEAGVPPGENALGNDPRRKRAPGHNLEITDRLVSLLRRQAHLSAAEIVAAIAQDAKSFIGDARRFDDQTLVVVKRTAAGAI